MISSIYIALIGMACGSFVSAWSHRFLHGCDWVRDRSRCPHCQHVLSVMDLIPVLSWVMRGAKCAYCHAPIHWRYPALELGCGAAFMLSAHTIPMGWGLVILLLAIILFFMISVVDAEAMLVPLRPIYIITMLGIAFATATQESIWSAGLSAALWGLGAWLLQRGYKLLRKRDGLGTGDVYIAMACGAWLSPDFISVFLFLAGGFGVTIALIMRSRGQERFAFAPALALAWFVCILWQQHVSEPIQMLTYWLQ